MRASNPKSILNPYEWLPCYGESSISFCSSGLDAIIIIEYEKEFDSKQDVVKLKRELVFEGVRFFIREPFPGNFLFDGLVVNNSGDLVIFKQSDLLDCYDAICSRKCSFSPPRLNHFYIQFLSENMTIHALAEDFSLSDETLL